MFPLPKPTFNLLDSMGNNTEHPPCDSPSSVETARWEGHQLTVGATGRSCPSTSFSFLTPRDPEEALLSEKHQFLLLLDPLPPSEEFSLRSPREQRGALEMLSPALPHRRAVKIAIDTFNSPPTLRRNHSFVLRRYELSNQALGHGMYGEVVRGVNRLTGEEVAIKRIPLEKSVRPEELEAARCLSHPNIVRTHEICTLEQEAFVVMELIEGISLEKAMEEDAATMQSLLRPFTKQLVEAIDYMHTSHWIHRDLKPANLMVTFGGEPRLKVVDFGLAKRLMEGDFLKTCCGSINFTAPEVFRHDEEGYGKAVDWWSLGIILSYIATSGATPFEDEDPLTTQLNILEAEIPDHFFLRVDPLLTDLIRALLNPDPTSRLGNRGKAEVLSHPFFK